MLCSCILAVSLYFAPCYLILSFIFCVYFSVDMMFVFNDCKFELNIQTYLRLCPVTHVYHCIALPPYSSTTVPNVLISFFFSFFIALVITMCSILPFYAVLSSHSSIKYFCCIFLLSFSSFIILTINIKGSRMIVYGYFVLLFFVSLFIFIIVVCIVSGLIAQKTRTNQFLLNKLKFCYFPLF